MSTNHSVPKNWEQYIIKKGKGETPGPPIIWGEPQRPEEVEPGYGFIPDETTDEETFFYHSDHLGSTSYITDDKGNVTQYTAYLPYGELLVDEHSSSEDLPYKFNGKELDEETGLYYYGARYLQPVASVWYGVDPLMEKYPNVSAYCYTLANPIRFIDTDGRELGDPPCYKTSKNMRTIGFALSHPFIAIQIGQVTKGATNISTNSTRFATRGNILYGSERQQEDRGSENGAFRHTLWQASITSKFGEDIAKSVGNVHEDNPFIDLSIRIFRNIDDADQTVDLLNNQIGRAIGTKNKNSDMKELAFLVLEEFKNNGLYIAAKKDKKWIVEKYKLSEQKYNQLKSIFNDLNTNGYTHQEQKAIDVKAQKKLESLQQTWGTMK